MKWGRQDTDHAADWELGLQTNNPSFDVFDQAEFDWMNGEPWDFEFGYDPSATGSAWLTVGDETVMSSTDIPSFSPNKLVVFQGTFEDQTSALTNVTIDGLTGPSQDMVRNTSGSQFWSFSDASLGSGFTMRRQVAMTDLNDAKSSGARPGAFIKVGEGPVDVPEPTGALLLAGGLIGLVGIGRRRGEGPESDS